MAQVLVEHGIHLEKDLGYIEASQAFVKLNEADDGDIHIVYNKQIPKNQCDASCLSESSDRSSWCYECLMLYNIPTLPLFKFFRYLDDGTTVAVFDRPMASRVKSALKR